MSNVFVLAKHAALYVNIENWHPCAREECLKIRKNVEFGLRFSARSISIIDTPDGVCILDFDKQRFIRVMQRLYQKNFQKSLKNACIQNGDVVYYGSCLFRDEAVSCRHGHGG